MTKEKIAEYVKIWWGKKELIDIEDLVWVDRLEDLGRDDEEKRLNDKYLKDYIWYMCPNSGHFASCSRLGSSYSDILFCSICQKHWIIANNIAERIRAEESSFMSHLINSSDILLRKYKKEDFDGKLLCTLKHTNGIPPDIIESIFDIKFGETIMAEFDKEWEAHCLRGKL